MIKKIYIVVIFSLIFLLIGCTNSTVDKLDEVISLINNAIPNKIYKDTTLFYSDNSDVQISYFSDDIEIFDGRLIYPFPDSDVEITLSIHLTYESDQRFIERTITLANKNDLPKIPEIHITVDSSINSKEEYVNGSLDLIDFDDKNKSSLLLDDATMSIRLRGNSTLDMPKKSYKIKFDSKQSMFTSYKEKDWVLLANHADQSLIRNALAFKMASKLKMEFVPTVNFVDVYINGEYQGNYLLTDQVEVTKNRVNIEENNPIIDTGYLIEFDKRLYQLNFITDENYFMIDGIPFVIKTPDFNDETYLDAHYNYIESYMSNVFDVLKEQGDYRQYIDEASFIDWYIVNEVFKNVDSGYSSVFYYKDAQGLLKMGPVWDFDLSTGNYGHLEAEARGPEGRYTSREDKNILFHYLMQNPTFRTALKTRWLEVYDEVILGLLDDINPTMDSITRSRYHNFLKWDIIGIENQWYTAPDILERDTYHKQVQFLRAFLIDRIR